MKIPRLHPPAAPATLQGWCLFKDDPWIGPVPQECDARGWRVYPTREAAFAGLAREMRRRCDEFEAGQRVGAELVCRWFPMRVTYLADGRVRDETGVDFEPVGSC
jgi:hypothetical protein